MVSNPFPLVLNIIEHPKKKQKHIENIGSFHIIETIFFSGGWDYMVPTACSKPTSATKG
jgi:hypothetical protein